MSALVRSSSSPSVSNMFDTTLPSVDVVRFELVLAVGMENNYFSTSRVLVLQW